MDQQHPDYYKLFEIEFKANEKEIRKAYRQKSLLCHPDRAGDDPKAAQMFHLITIALETLLDPSKRKIHDDLILAKRQRETRFKEMDQARQFSKTKLEERESQAKKLKTDQDATKLKLEEIREKTKYKMKAREQMQKQTRAAATMAVNMMEQGKAIIAKATVMDCTVKVKLTGNQDETSLKNELSRYGPIDKILVGKKKASVIFQNVRAAFNAVQDANALFKIEPLMNPEPEAFQYLRGSGSIGIQTGFQGKEYEEMTLNKLKSVSKSD